MSKEVRPLWPAFVGSENFFRVLQVCEQTGRAMSEILGLDDGYTAFCLDEAAVFARMRLKSGDRPVCRQGARSFAAWLEGGR